MLVVKLQSCIDTVEVGIANLEAPHAESGEPRK